MALLTGFFLVLLAGLLQGTFVLPMTLVKRWSWEHTWATFSLLGMFLFNWIITLLLVPNIFAVYAASPSHDLMILALFGAGWGVGAVLFGLGMDRLGMALGYPIIMGLIASLGALIPLLVFFPQTLLTERGLVLLAGTALVIFGIVLCSIGWIAQLAVRHDNRRGSCVHGRPDHRDCGWHSVVPAERGGSIRNGGHRGCGANGYLAIRIGKYSLGPAVHPGMCGESCLLRLPDDFEADARPILEPGDPAQPGLKRFDGPDVDWKFLSLRRGRGQAGTLGSGSGLAAVHFPLDCDRESLGTVERGMARRSVFCPALAESGSADADRRGYCRGAEQLGLIEITLETSYWPCGA